MSSEILIKFNKILLNVEKEKKTLTQGNKKSRFNLTKEVAIISSYIHRESATH